MVDVLSNVVQIVVLSSGPDALLSVDGSHPSCHVAVRVDSAEKNWFELEQEGTNMTWNEVSVLTNVVECTG